MRFEWFALGVALGSLLTACAAERYARPIDDMPAAYRAALECPLYDCGEE